MKKLLLALGALLFISTMSEAQESYTVPVGATNVIRVDHARIRWNQSVCTRLNAVGAPNCTQAQACVAAGVVGGASCTVANARAADVEIFANSLAGRELYFIHQLLVKLVAPGLKDADVVADHSTQQLNWNAGNDTVKNAMCLAAGPPVPATVALGCSLYP